MGFLNRLKNSFYESIGVSTDYEVAKSNLDNFNRKKQLAESELNICRKVIEDIKKVFQIAEDDLVIKGKDEQLSYDIAKQKLKVDMLKSGNNSSIDTILLEDKKLKDLIEMSKYAYLDEIISGRIQQFDIKNLLSEIVSYCNSYHLFENSVSITSSRRDLEYILMEMQKMLGPMEVNNIVNERGYQVMKNRVDILEEEDKFRKKRR